MEKKISLIFIVVFLSITSSLAQWVSLDNNSYPGSKPDVRLLSDNVSSTVIRVNLPGFTIKEFNAGDKIFHSVDIGSMGITSESGMPEIPYIAKILAIPGRGIASVEVLETGKSRIIKGINIPPARKSWSEGEPETQYLENEKVYRSENLYPNQYAIVEDPVVFRDFRIARVCIFPIRYSPAKHEIEAIPSITIRIKYGGGSGVNPKLTLHKPISPSFAKLYKSIIFNYKEVLQREYNNREDGYDLMLCIMPDSLADSFLPYAEWNHKTGTFIHITKFSEIGASGSNPTAVRDHILDAYTNWAIPPTYVLLVGDAGVAPVKYITLDNWTFTYDDYFVELEGNDFFPEMMIGRFTNQGNYRLTVMINKFKGYERTPYITDPDWFRKGLVCSNDEYESQIDTKRFAAQEMLTNGDFISVDSMFNGYICPGNSSDIVNMINAGRGFLNYRGEGWYSGWAASCFPLSTSNINSLNNGSKLTFVTSIGCGVANFDNGSYNNFGEAWVEIGDEFAPRGACAFLGPVSNTHTAYNNSIDMGIYIGMFEEGLDSPGEALLRGKFYMYQVFGGVDPYVGYHYRIYHVLGDPSLHIWKDTPRNILVNYTDTIGIGTGQIQVMVTDAVNRQPVANVQVCISGNNIYSIGFTNTNGAATLYINPQTTGQLDFTVSGENVIPFEGTIQVAEGVINTFSLTVSVDNGWNMVSVPGTNPDGQGVNNWWSGHTGSVYKFIPGSGYSDITTVTPGEGYWMKNNGANVYNTGDEWPAGGIQIVSHEPIDASTGWNLIGGFENPVDVASMTTVPPGQIQLPLYHFVPGQGYQESFLMVPGFGYWVKVSSGCQIILPDSKAYNQDGSLISTSASDLKNVQPLKKLSFGTITFTDAADNRYTLYALNGETEKNTNVDLSRYELPPVPPSGLFDIRYESGRIIEDLSSTKSILLSGIKYPLRIRVEKMSIALQYDADMKTSTIIRPGEEITINSSSIERFLISEETIPVSYTLEQNFPNPFNPSTTIRYSISVDGFVSIYLYNPLGEKVAEIISGFHKAGSHQVTFNASGLSSGIYLYRMQSGNLSFVRKMVILK